MGCDTFVVLADATADGAMVFGKNSDRDRNEAQYIDVVERTEHPVGTVQCTHIAIPQVSLTYAVCAAVWLLTAVAMWGAEMGCNEFGVCIGNEALFCEQPPQVAPALTGMDLVRLALERSRTAAHAVDIIADLLRAHGQGGLHAAATATPNMYHNAFLIADPLEAWHMECVGSTWAAGCFRSGVVAISNTPSLARAAIVKQSTQTFSAVPDSLVTAAACGGVRRARVHDLLRAAQPVTLLAAFDVLRDHGLQGGHAATFTGCDVCAHAGAPPVRVAQTTGAMVVSVARGVPTVWATATAAPCLSVFRPLWLTCARPARVPGVCADDSLWWTHERAHRRHTAYPGAAAAALTSARQSTQAELVRRAVPCPPPAAQPAVAAECWAIAAEFTHVVAALPAMPAPAWARAPHVTAAPTTAGSDGHCAASPALLPRVALAVLTALPGAAAVSRAAWVHAAVAVGLRPRTVRTLAEAAGVDLMTVLLCLCGVLVLAYALYLSNTV